VAKRRHRRRSSRLSTRIHARRPGLRYAVAALNLHRERR
jgi:hypothetical protein